MKKTLIVLSMFCILTSLVFAMNLSDNDSATEDIVLGNETTNDSTEVIEENIPTEDNLTDETNLDDDSIGDNVTEENLTNETDLNNNSVEDNITDETSEDSELEDNITPEDLDEVINNDWKEQAKVTPSDRKLGIMFGHSVSINKDYLVVGAIFDDENGLGSGSVYVFKFDGNEWVEEQKLIASDGKAGDLFGYSVSVEKDYISVNSYKNHKYVFKFNGEEWVEEKKSEIDKDKNILEKSVSSDDFTISSNFDKEENSYSVYVSKKGESKKELTANDKKENDLFGNSVSIGENKAVVGAVFDGEEGIGSGSVYVYKLS